MTPQSEAVPSVSGHTVGPWTYDGGDGYGDLVGHRVRTQAEAEYIVAVTLADVPQLETESRANALLIAAAPELLEALIAAESLFYNTFAQGGTIHKKMQSAIAKATQP